MIEIQNQILGSFAKGGEKKYRRPQSLPEQIAQQISQAILRGDYGPGDPIKEQNLADTFQVSRGPIREALRILEKDGVVQILPNRGAHITRLSSREVRDIFEIRAALSQLVIRYLCNTRDEELRQGFIAGAAGITELAKGEDLLDEYVNESFKLSQMLANSSENMRLAEMMQSLARQTMRYTLLGLRRTDRSRKSAAIWQKLSTSVGNRDEKTSGRYILQLINDSMSAAIEELEAEATSQTTPE